jgi:hypothetical protein
VTEPRPSAIPRVVAVAAALTAATATLIYAAGAAILIRYPYEWDPSEGGALDGAWRLIHDPAQLYPHGTVVPSPLPLPPLQALLHVPFVLASGADLRGPRVLSALIVVAILAAMYLLVRRAGGSRLVACVTAATLLAGLGDSFWLMLVRVDGLMIALLLWAAVVGLPRQLGRGADALSVRRALATAALLVLACLAKPSAALHGAPLVLVWALVDRRSCARLIAATLALGVGVAGALDLATHGGFVAANRLWTLHGESAAQAVDLAGRFATSQAPLVAALVVVAVVAWRAGARPLGDPAWALYLGGAFGLALLGKFGAWTSYLLLWVAAHGVLLGRLTARAGKETLGLALAALVILCGLLRSSFPVPTAQNRASAQFLAGVVRARGAPLLASKLESLYVAVGQDAEIESDGFVFLMHAHAPGIERIFERLDGARYRTVVVHANGLPLQLMRLLGAHYTLVAACDIGFWHATYRYAIWVPRADAASLVLTPPPDAACAIRP